MKVYIYTYRHGNYWGFQLCRFDEIDHEIPIYAKAGYYDRGDAEQAAMNYCKEHEMECEVLV